MKKIALGLAALVASSSTAFAKTCGGVLGQTCDVPEISALEGTAAIAALAAVVLLAWERRRRAL